MVRKISTFIIVVFITITGVYSFIHLGYWNRSVRIFNMNSDQPGFGEGGRGRGGFEGREREFGGGLTREVTRGERRQFPDSLRRLSDERDFRALPDSIQRKIRSGEFRGDRGDFRGGPGFGRRGGDFHGGSSISLGKVAGFLAVFALFALAAIGVDNGLHWFRIRKKTGHVKQLSEQ